MKRNIFFFLLVLLPIQLIGAQTIFTIAGPEESYNQIRVTNETTQDAIRCMLVVLDESGNAESTYGIYNLVGKHDTDSNTGRIARGKRVEIKMPKDFPFEVGVSIDYIDTPFFDIVVVKIYDKTTEFSEDK